MKADNLISQLTRQSTILKGCFIKKLTLKGYFDVLRLLRIDNELQNSLKEVVKRYKTIPKAKFRLFYDKVTRHIKETRMGIFKNTLTCKNKHFKQIDKIISKNDKAMLKSIKDGKQFVFKSKVGKAGLNLLYKAIVKLKYLTYNDLPDILITQAYQFNYAEILKQTDKSRASIKSDRKLQDAYLVILAALAGSFSKSDIDSLTIEQATELAGLVRMEKVKLYYSTHFQGIRYHSISQSSFKNDDNGSKRQKVLSDIHSELVKQMKPKDDKQDKSKYIQAMEREALEVLKAKACKAGSN
jgi:hypothetical protein